MIQERRKTYRCIYCLQEKPKSEFNREHVIPQMFGTYSGDNLVLHDNVCINCNSFFSRELEDKVSLDSYEAFLRTAKGSKQFKSFKQLGRNNLHFSGSGPVVESMPFEVYAHSDGRSNELIYQPKSVIGIMRDESNRIYDFYSIEDLPPCSPEEQARLRKLISPYSFCGYEDKDIKRIIEALESKGYDVSNIGFGSMPFSEIIDDSISKIELFVKNDIINWRLSAKVMYNFLCKIYGAAFVLEPGLDELREFILYGINNDFFKNRMFSSTESFSYPHCPKDGHCIGTGITEIDKKDYLCVFVSWFSKLSYIFAIKPLQDARNGIPKHFYFTFDNRQRTCTSFSNLSFTIPWKSRE